MKFSIIKKAPNSLARRGLLQLAHGKVQTPAFMPCATGGAVKGISAEELQSLGYELILANTYHLYLRPGEKEIRKLGGLNKFMNWPKPILTDSGGYQVFSLGKKWRALNPRRNYSGEMAFASLVEVNSEGVWFKSHLDGSKHFFSPEKVLAIQNDLGSDIAMVLDECTEFPATFERARESLAMTHHWAKRSREYWQRFKNPRQALFGIIQGSTYKNLREISAKYIASLDFDGLAVGGVSVGEGKTKMYKVMRWLGPWLDKDKPHYLMGVGEPEDIMEAVKRGFDLFDCVLPTRLGRHGTVWATTNWQKFRRLDLRQAQYRQDKKVIMKDCGCPACSSGYSRAYIGHLVKAKEMLGMRLASLHNLWLINELMKKIRQSI